MAQHEAVTVLKRLHERKADIQHVEFEELFQQRLGQKLSRIHNGYQPESLNGTPMRLLRDAGLLLNQQGKTRTLYSLRHTYATQVLLASRTHIHTLARQMGNSAAMIERHYSK
jgi:integrase